MTFDELWAIGVERTRLAHGEYATEADMVKTQLRLMFEALVMHRDELEIQGFRHIPVGQGKKCAHGWWSCIECQWAWGFRDGFGGRR